MALYLTGRAFLSTLSLRRATWPVASYATGQINFYPRSPCGERHTAWNFAGATYYFYPRSPCGERLVKLVSNSNITTNFYPRSPCGERPWHLHCVFIFAGISIHALLAESDKKSFRSLDTGQIFLSTLSLRRATSKTVRRIWRMLHFYPRSPCGERQRPRWLIDFIINISIHALLAESDRKCRPCEAQAQAFLSTLSLRRATQNFPKAAACVHISIHALLAESDPMLCDV